MTSALCIVPVAPVRVASPEATENPAAAGDGWAPCKTEMVTQMLLGEACHIHARHGHWALVETAWDRYRGWMDHRQLLETAEPGRRDDDDDKADPGALGPSAGAGASAAALPPLSPDSFSLSLLGTARGFNRTIRLPFGSTLPRYSGGAFFLGNEPCRFRGPVARPEHQRPPATGQAVAQTARRFLGVPYLWGGRTVLGIDCSGLAQLVYKVFGHRLRRDAVQQAEQGMDIDFRDAQPGDLAFFASAPAENDAPAVTHVGILLGKNRIIHASAQVRVDRFDRAGIFNEALGRHTHHHHSIKRIII